MTEPIATEWAWLDALVGPVDDDFKQAANQTPGEQHRPELNVFDGDTGIPAWPG